MFSGTKCDALSWCIDNIFKTISYTLIVMMLYLLVPILLKMCVGNKIKVRLDFMIGYIESFFHQLLILQIGGNSCLCLLFLIRAFIL